MPFNYLCLMKIKDANKHDFSFLKTETFHLHTVFVKNITEAIEVSLKYIKENDIKSIMLCPGFTSTEVGEIDKAAGENICISVARSDHSSTTFTAIEGLKKEGVI
ncbi:MAG: hypothetical protein GY756_04230 [bacterium]|nr:hypothetical protein [bacterium]